MNVEEAGRLMRDQRIRHLPVCDEAGKLLGIVSIGDINAHHVRMQQDAIQHLEAYVYHNV
jgi:CBS-domain-containing membrane protein